MKKFLRLVALIVASAVPGMSVAATDYGIRIAGTVVSSDNASNITNEYIKSGTIKYDYSEHSLTFDNVWITKSSYNQVVVLSTAGTPTSTQLKMVFKGYNRIEYGNGVTFNISKRSDLGNASPTVYFMGDGALECVDGVIACFNGASVGFGESNNNTVNGGLDVYAKAVYAQGEKRGSCWVTDANLHLTGISGYGALYNFEHLYCFNGIWPASIDGETLMYSESKQNIVNSELATCVRECLCRL